MPEHGPQGGRARQVPAQFDVRQAPGHRQHRQLPPPASHGFTLDDAAQAIAAAFQELTKRVSSWS